MLFYVTKLYYPWYNERMEHVLFGGDLIIILKSNIYRILQK